MSTTEREKPEKQAKLVKPVSKRIAEKNMEAMLRPSLKADRARLR